MRLRKKKLVREPFDEHTREACDLGGCDICLSYWDLLDLMLRESAADLPVQGEPPKMMTGVWPKREGEDTVCLSDLDDPTEPPECDDCGEHREGYGDCPAVQGEPRP